MILPASPMGCPVDSLLRLLMGPWTTYILYTLQHQGPTRFGALKRLIPGISAKVLSERLKMLEHAGVIFRQQKASIPPQVTYGLTARGDELRSVIDALEDVARRWAAEDAGEAIAAAEAAAAE
ncbi:MAG: helix-turn-helix domain-containing protein [Alphaproteobacteria bacterium]|jgi:DNA-binding HxlR family transcriptional regulator|nr:transcriptional regulator [Rhodospirillaceae bacterium]MDP6623365.1 helix-turn-helix domain-containing protein [Alphaproteobacteria bacterium]MDP7604783.1 helix-turn-helix domain-containing protein [Alphaproteobacteria bacterium]HJP19996.1 helix-turn-helix domain-containing protein [Alphaproteobacteria bacterium]|tara:strand:- start:1019 stop:1387 length:369 start_codon:yes stop_codon:yes gene_type:complete